MPCTAYVGYRRCGVYRSSRGSTQPQRRTEEEKRREEKRRDDGTRSRTVKYHPRETRAGPILSKTATITPASASDPARDEDSARARQPVAAQFCFERPTHPPSHTHTRAPCFPTLLTTRSIFSAGTKVSNSYQALVAKPLYWRVGGVAGRRRSCKQRLVDLSRAECHQQ